MTTSTPVAAGCLTRPPRHTAQLCPDSRTDLRRPPNPPGIQLAAAPRGLACLTATSRPRCLAGHQSRPADYHPSGCPGRSRTSVTSTAPTGARPCLPGTTASSRSLAAFRWDLRRRRHGDICRAVISTENAPSRPPTNNAGLAFRGPSRRTIQRNRRRLAAELASAWVAKGWVAPADSAPTKSKGHGALRK
jgi:hypothetical protein